MKVANKYHLTYCTNIHPGENWQVTFDSLRENVIKIKERIAPEIDFGIGLRLSNKASLELGLEEKLHDFKNWLKANNLYVFTMNGFPYGNFHGEKVKDKVHAPDWTTDERLDYTQRLFKQLSYLLPDDITGGISTSPISYKHWFKNEVDLDKAKSIGAANMLNVAIQLYRIEKDSGKYLHLDIEPEPDGILENSDEVLLFFNDYLIPQGITLFQKHFGFDNVKSEILIKKYLTVCYDICHFSLAYEEPSDTISKFSEEGIKVGKIQVSAALKILFGENDEDKVWNALEKFNEPTYLHQVTEYEQGIVKTYSDLPVVLRERPKRSELRAHFHVPIFLEKFTHLYSTKDHILKVLSYLSQVQFCEHLEIETYTWDVLPKELKKELSDSIIREVIWLKERVR